MLRLTSLLLVLVVTVWPTSAAEYFVSSTGDDSNPGNKDRPFRTIQEAADQLTAGDTCYVRGGIYRELVTVKSSGQDAKPIRFVAVPGEIVTLSGTEPITGQWERDKGSVYRIHVDRVFDQLFVDGTMMIEARWPNATLDQMLDRSQWAHARKGSRYGRIQDPELAKTGIDWTGAIATLNVTHQFYTWTRHVIRHKPGQDFFEYPKDFDAGTEMRYADKTAPWEDDRYYLSGKREALDTPTEWFLNRNTKTLYLWLSDGRSPAEHVVEAKFRDFAFVARDVHHIELEGFHFFGATFSFRQSHHCLVDRCHLLFPTYARESTELAPPAERKELPRTEMVGDFNTVRNSSLAYSPTDGLVMAGHQNIVENNLIHDVCWTGSLRHVAVGMGQGARSQAEPGGIVRHNTMFDCGNAIINYRSQPYRIEYNHVWNGGLACKDVALIYTGQPSCAGSVVQYNWVHGCRTEEGAGLGIRGDDQTRQLTVHHNVVWDCGRDGIIIKGDNNRVHNNTCLFIGTKSRLGNYIALPTRAEPVKPWRRQHALLPVQNEHSFAYNNVARTINGNQSRRTPFPFPKCLANNYQGDDPRLESPANWDFRPAENSPLIDAGKAIPGITDRPSRHATSSRSTDKCVQDNKKSRTSRTEGFVGRAPDCGAYESGVEPWKPGHRNGLWVSAPTAGDSAGTKRVRVALLMPPLENVTVTVASIDRQTQLRTGTTLAFTPDRWQHPQDVTFIQPGTTEGGVLQFHVAEWGTIDMPLGKVKSQTGWTAWFPQPDLGRPQPLDDRFNTLYFPERSTGAPRTVVKPAARAYYTTASVNIDGRINSSEWPNETPDRVMRLRPLRHENGPTDSAGQCYAQFDATRLYLAFQIQSGRLRRMGVSRGAWGRVDGVEVDLQTVGDNKLGPVFVLHGFPTGELESGAINVGGASSQQAAELVEATQFAAQVGDGRWTAEFAIPFAALDIDETELKQLQFNVGARVGTGDDGEWFAWAKTGRANYALEKAGTMTLRPAVAVTARNLVTQSDFENPDLAPWRKAINARHVPEAMTIERVPEGADGGWCMKIECHDAQLMKKGVLKWLYPLSSKLKPGVYVLSYDLRVAKLQPRDRSGMFCSYLRTVTGPGAGRNEGQNDYGFAGKELNWTRRDCVITIPKGAKLSYVSLQLHKATGTAWIDNVAVHECK